MSAMKFERYALYKDSCAHWLGEIPSCWKLQRHKDAFQIISLRCINPSYLKVALENIEGKTGRFISSDSEFDGDGIQFKRNDILFGKLRPYLAKVYLAEFNGNAIGDIFVYRPKPKVAPLFAAYLMRSDRYIDAINSSTAGAKMPRASSGFIADLPVAIPSLAEQTAITTYLDTKTSQIDRQINLLGKKVTHYGKLRQSLINETVIRGLDRSVSMKDSGVDWIGEVPEHWAVTAITNITDTVSHKNHPNEELLSVYRDYGVIIKSSRDDNNNKAGADLSSYKLVEPGFLVINKMKAWQGSLGVSEFRGIVSPAYITCKTNKKIVDRSYLHHLLRCRNYINEYNRLSFGVRVDQWDMRYDDFKYVPVLLPSRGKTSSRVTSRHFNLSKVQWRGGGYKSEKRMLPTRPLPILDSSESRRFGMTIFMHHESLLAAFCSHFEVQKVRLLIQPRRCTSAKNWVFRSSCARFIKDEYLTTLQKLALYCADPRYPWSFWPGASRCGGLCAVFWGGWSCCC